MKAAVLVASLGSSDATSYDALYQHNTLATAGQGLSSVELFAGHVEAGTCPSVNVGDLPAFEAWCGANPDGLVVFHYTDGQTAVVRRLCDRPGPTVVRWHNATPPWFTLIHQPSLATHALTGYETIASFIEAQNIIFWANSKFTRSQLEALGASRERCHVVYPATAYLDRSTPPGRPGTATAAVREYPPVLLFVGRIAPNKGHANLVNVAARVQEMSGASVRLVLVGRRDRSLRTFNGMLDKAIAASGVDVQFLGSVSDEELSACYGDADVFVSMSEHEGFGLPVMEAMRCGLPVVAWATTAMRETLDGHPFAFEEFSPDLFAAAILSLRDPAVRARVLATQARLSARYTAETVRGQLHDALRDTLRPDDARPSGSDSHETVITRDLRRLVALSRAVTARPARVVHDSGQNLLSGYDLFQYPLIASALKRQKFAPLAPLSTDPVVLLQAEEFSAPRGEIGEDRNIYFSEASYDERYLVYGPYVQFPSGEYVATVKFAVQTAVMSPRFEVDVGCTGAGVLAKVVVSGPDALSDAPSLRFKVADEGGAIEIRLRPIAPFVGALTFGGVEVREFGATASGRSPASVARSRFKWGRLFTRLLGSRAQGYFEVGRDHARVRRWADAVDAYEAGLTLKPDHFGVRVQIGHALKELGRLADAETHYLHALDLRPEDQDLNFQLGHFYKMQGNVERAASFYVKALEGSPLARAAAIELSGLGVPTNRWS